MKNTGLIALGTILLMGLNAQADPLTIDCQDTLTDSHIQLDLSDTSQISPTSVQLIANGSEFKAKAVSITQTEAGINEVVVTSGEGTLDFNYQFKNLDVVDCLGTAEPDKAKPTHIEVVAWSTVVSWVQCRCVAKK